MFGEVNESVKAYGLGGHRHVAEIEQELRVAAEAPVATRRQPRRVAVDFLPHLIPMTRGILSTQPRPPDPAASARPSSTSCTPRPTPTSRS